MNIQSIAKPRLFLQKIFLAIVSVLTTTVIFAQGDGKSVDINVNTNKDNFWASPWVWVVGGAVFVLLLAAILRGGGSRKDA